MCQCEAPLETFLFPSLPQTVLYSNFLWMHRLHPTAKWGGACLAYARFPRPVSGPFSEVLFSFCAFSFSW